MKVLVVCSKNAGKVAPFIIEQVEAISLHGVETDFFYIQRKGIWGYLLSRKDFIRKLKALNPDVVHAHYGLSGLLANLQRKVPVITTYHGSDINYSLNRLFSKITIYLSAYNIFVSDKLIQLIKPKNNYACIPCGVNLALFQPMDKAEARKQLGLEQAKQYILFSSSFALVVKNYPLAKAAVERISGVELIELKGYTREQVALLMNASDVVLMTSFTEGSPQFIKEAMACNVPIVSTRVGDVSDLLENEVGCFLTSYDLEDVVAKLTKALSLKTRTNTRNNILPFDNALITSQIIQLYNSILKHKK